MTMADDVWACADDYFFGWFYAELSAMANGKITHMRIAAPWPSIEGLFRQRA